jgi:hypothetical protein
MGARRAGAPRAATRCARVARVTPLERLRRTQIALIAVVAGTSVLWALTAALVTRAVMGALGPLGASWAVSAIVGGLVAVGMLWRGRAVGSIEQTALWVESRAPQLQYALVTAIEPSAAHAAGELARVIGGVEIQRLVYHAGARTLARASVGVVAAVALVAVVPVAGQPAALFSVRVSGAPDAPNRIATIVVRVLPPAYTHQSPREIREPSIVTALVGSIIDVVGRGASAGVRAAVGSDSVVVLADGSGWRTRLTMPARPRVLRLRDRDYERVISLDPVADTPPTVILDRPGRDSTLRSTRGDLALVARVTDDIGLRDGYFELIISAGDEEGSFRSAERRIGAVEFGGVTHAPMETRIDLATLGLSAGGRLSIRAVARDANPVSGPGIGVSETRTFRIAKPQEYDSLAVEGEPPPALDSTYLSQRMIVIRTRELLRAASRLRRDTVARRAAALAEREEGLRERVQSLLNGPGEAEGGGPLLLPDWQRALFDSAFQALGDAAGDLHAVTLTAAIPPERVALRVLDRARVANRLYLRGGHPTIVVNTERVRLIGPEKPDAGPRTSEPSDDTTALAAVARLESIARPGGRSPSEVADSIAVLRLAVIGVWPGAASALAEAADAVRAHRDPRAALARARRAIVGAPSVGEGLSPWDAGR